jgi:hypothetical protein
MIVAARAATTGQGGSGGSGGSAEPKVSSGGQMKNAVRPPRIVIIFEPPNF